MLYTNKQLINELLKYPPEQIVLVDGYEMGFDNIKTTEADVLLNSCDSNFCGVHEVDEYVDKPIPDFEPIKMKKAKRVKAIILKRTHE
jgi:hypothetical protein